MPRLSDTQAILLAAAADRKDLRLYPIPDRIKLKGAALGRTIKALIRRGFIADRAVGGGSRQSKPVGDSLIITRAGLAAIGVELPNRTPDPAKGPEGPHPRTVAVPRPDRPGGKLGLLLDAVAGPNGATLEDLTTRTGWQPHTTRAALTRLRQRGFDVRLGAATGGRKAYRLTTAA